MVGEVPTGWTRRQLVDLCVPVRNPVDVNPESTYQEIGIRSHGKGVFVKPTTTGMRLGAKQVFHVVPNAFVANIVFAWEGALARTTAEHAGMVASHRFPMWQPIPDRLDLDFLVYFFRTASGVALAAQASPGGAGRNRTLNQTAFLRSSLLLPPLPEQQKIAAILSSVDEAIQATQAVIDQTRRVKEGLLQDLLTRGLPGHTRFKQTEIGEIPEGWEVACLGDVAEVRSGIAINSNRELSNPVEVAYLRVANVQDGFLDLAEVKRIQVEEADVSRFALRAGDVLMNEGGDIDKLGRGDVWDGRIEPCVHQNHVFSVRSGSRLRPRYLAYLAESPLGKAYFLATGKQTTNLASINKSQLRAFPVPLPTLVEQDGIVERLAAVRNGSERAQSEVRSLMALKSGLLADLLTGKVRVTP